MRVGDRKFHALKILLGTLEGQLGVGQAGAAAVLLLLGALDPQLGVLHCILPPGELKLKRI